MEFYARMPAAGNGNFRLGVGVKHRENIHFG